MNLTRTRVYGWMLLRSWGWKPWVVSLFPMFLLWLHFNYNFDALLGGIFTGAGGFLVASLLLRIETDFRLPMLPSERAIGTALALSIPVWFWGALLWIWDTAPYEEIIPGQVYYEPTSSPPLWVLFAAPLALTSVLVTGIWRRRTRSDDWLAPILIGIAAGLMFFVAEVVLDFALHPAGRRLVSLVLLLAAYAVVGVLASNAPVRRSPPVRAPSRRLSTPRGALRRGLSAPSVLGAMALLALSWLAGYLAWPLKMHFGVSGGPGLVPTAWYLLPVLVGWLVYRDMLWSDLSHVMPERHHGARLEFRHLPVRDERLHRLLRAWTVGVLATMLLALPSFAETLDAQSGMRASALMTMQVMPMVGFWLVLLQRQLDGLHSSRYPRALERWHLMLIVLVLSSPLVTSLHFPSLQAYMGVPLSDSQRAAVLVGFFGTPLLIQGLWGVLVIAQVRALRRRGIG